MNYRKWIGVSSTALFLMLILTKYQNCAPPPGAAPVDTSADESSEVRIIDDWRQNKVTFVSPDAVEIAAASGEDYKIDGLCARTYEGSLNWALVESDSSAIVDGGSVPCELGGFRIRLNGINQIECGVTHLLEVESAEGDRDNLIVERACT